MPDMINVHTICHKTRIRCRIFFQFFLRHIFLQCFGHVIGVLLFPLDVFSAFFLYVIWLLQKKQVRGGFGLTSVIVIFRTLDSSSFCMGKTFDLLLKLRREPSPDGGTHHGKSTALLSGGTSKRDQEKTLLG